MMGRPRKRTPEQIEAALKAELAEYPNRPAIMGVCHRLDIDRQTLLDWAREKDGPYSGIAKKIVTVIGSCHERNLWESKGGASTGSIFWLKCHRWYDNDSQVSVEGNIKKLVFKNSAGAKVGDGV